jgi:hypothetical protein
VAPRDVPLSTESPEAAGAGCVARRGVQQARLVDPVACSIAGRLEACPAGAPSAPHDSGGTTRGAGRAHSSEWRTGSTPGSPDQRSAGDGAGHWDASRRARVAESVQSQLSCGDGSGCRQLASGAEPARPRLICGVLSGVLKRSPTAPTVTYGYPQFPQVYPQRVRGYESALIQRRSANPDCVVDNTRGDVGIP